MGISMRYWNIRQDITLKLQKKAYLNNYENN